MILRLRRPAKFAGKSARGHLAQVVGVVVKRLNQPGDLDHAREQQCGDRGKAACLDEVHADELEQANKLDAQLEQMRVRTAKQMEKLKAAEANAKSLAQFEAAIHKIEDIDAFIRLDKGDSSDINADHMEDLGRNSISIAIERIGQFEVQKPKMIHGPINDDRQKIINNFERYALLD